MAPPAMTIEIPDLSARVREELVRELPPGTLSVEEPGPSALGGQSRDIATATAIVTVSLNLTNALGDGRATDLIFNRLESLQEDRRRLEGELACMEGEIAAATVKRPTAEMVCAAWGQIVDLWGVLTEDERKEVMGGLVQEVVVT